MTPPRLATALLRLRRHAGRRAEIEADAAELFVRRSAVHGRRYARRRYWIDVLSFSIPRRQGRLHHRTSTTHSTKENRRMMTVLDAGLPFAQIRTLRDMAQPEMRPWRLGSTLFVLFGAAALFVATAGVYALLSFIVTQRSREIGVRLALGASPAHTLRMVVRQSLGWVIGGLIAGLAAALIAGRFIQPLLFETSPYDTTVFAATAALLVSVATGASLAPAIRASRVDPNVTLRAE